MFFSPFRLFYALAEFNLSLMSAPLRLVGSSSATGASHEPTLVAERPIESPTKLALDSRADVPPQVKAPTVPAVASMATEPKAEAASSHAVSVVIASIAPAPVAPVVPSAAVARIASPPPPRSVAEAVRAVAPAPVLRPSVPSKIVGGASPAKAAPAKSPVAPAKTTQKKKKR